MDMELNRDFLANDDLLPSVCYRDLVPGDNEEYLFRDYYTTVGYIREAVQNSSRASKPLYPFWILSESVEDLMSLVYSHLEGSEQAEPGGVNWTKRRSSRTC